VILKEIGLWQESGSGEQGIIIMIEHFPQPRDS
jgi:hypothetical protein